MGTPKKDWTVSVSFLQLALFQIRLPPWFHQLPPPARVFLATLRGTVCQLCIVQVRRWQSHPDMPRTVLLLSSTEAVRLFLS